MKNINITAILFLSVLLFASCNTSAQNEEFDNETDSNETISESKISLLFLISTEPF